jgi:hypothetical protein
MKRPTLSITALVFLFLGASTARADLISWGYQWTANPTSVTAGGGSVSLIADGMNFPITSSDVVAAALQVNSSASATAPDTFGPHDGNYSLKIDLLDIASGKTGSLTFTGQMQGSFSLTSANVSNTFLAPATQSLRLGDTLFTVALNAYTPPGPANEGNKGSIGATVIVANVPEPATLMLAALGFGMAGLAGWRSRRRRPA